MQCQYINESQPLMPQGVEQKVVSFQTHFEGCMEMYSDAETVANYFNAHEEWFCRCAEPMKTEAIGNNGYILVVGQYGAFGHEVEPKMAVVLDPPVEGVYKMYSIPLESNSQCDYQVDYQALMSLAEIPSSEAAEGFYRAFEKQGKLPQVITKVTWQLHLEVSVHFPKFISKLPMALIQKTGDRLLAQIIRQVSPRLTYKVQQNFHDNLRLPMPSKNSRQLSRIDVV